MENDISEGQSHDNPLRKALRLQKILRFTALILLLTIVGATYGFLPSFLSVVFVVCHQSAHIEELFSVATSGISSLVSDYKLIVVDNASDEDSVSVLKNLTGENGLTNLQLYALTKEVDTDTATLGGLENALGDFVAVIDNMADDIGFFTGNAG